MCQSGLHAAFAVACGNSSAARVLHLHCTCVDQLEYYKLSIMQHWHLLAAVLDIQLAAALVSSFVHLLRQCQATQSSVLRRIMKPCQQYSLPHNAYCKPRRCILVFSVVSIHQEAKSSTARQTGRLLVKKVGSLTHAAHSAADCPLLSKYKGQYIGRCYCSQGQSSTTALPLCRNTLYTDRAAKDLTYEDSDLYYPLNAALLPEAFPDFYKGTLTEKGGCKGLQVTACILRVV